MSLDQNEKIILLEILRKELTILEHNVSIHPKEKERLEKIVFIMKKIVDEK